MRFYFLQGFLNPPNYEVASLKIITSASKLRENKYPLSLDPKKILRPHQDSQLYPMVLSMKGRLCRACMVPMYCDCVYCTAFVTLSSHWAIKLLIPTSAAIMLPWWSKLTRIFMRLIPLRRFRASDNSEIHFEWLPPLYIDCLRIRIQCSNTLMSDRFSNNS